MEIKRTKSKLGENVIRVLPLIEEIIDAKVIPLCLIGVSSRKKNKVIHAHFATISNDEQTENALYEICRQFVENKNKNKENTINSDYNSEVL